MTAGSSNQRRWKLWAGLFALATAWGLLNFGIIVTDRMSDHEPVRLGPPLLDELTGAYAGIFVLMPAFVWLMFRFPITRQTWPRRVPLHLLATVLYGVSDTLLMWGSRTLLYPLFGLGTYEYGDLRYRFLMEYHKQFLGYCLVYVLVVFVARQREARERETRQKELERQLAEARLSALKMQLNPHFLFNALNMISAFVHEEPKRADTMIAHLSDFLRLTLSHAEAQEVPMEKELEFLRAYLAIMEARFGDRLQVEVDVGPGARRALIPHLILQPLVENAVKHCTAEPARPGIVRVEATRWDGRLSLIVHDNGPGLSGDPDEALEGGVGLSNTRERLATLYGSGSRMEFSKGPLGGLRIAIELPFREAGTK